MPQSSSQAFVLSSAPVNEQDKLIHLLTIDRGILKAVAPGALKARNRFGSLLELFTEGNFFYYWNEEKEMITISKGDLITSFFNTVSQSKNIFYFYLITEILLKIIPQNQRDKRIYRLVNSLLLAGAQGIDMNLILLYFQIWILRIEGLMFNPRICYNCFAKNLNNAWIKTDFRGIICSGCKTREKYPLSGVELDYIEWTTSHAPDKGCRYIPEINIKKMNLIFLKKIEYHAECQMISKQYLTEFS